MAAGGRKSSGGAGAPTGRLTEVRRYGGRPHRSERTPHAGRYPGRNSGTELRPGGRGHTRTGKGTRRVRVSEAAAPRRAAPRRHRGGSADNAPRQPPARPGGGRFERATARAAPPPHPCRPFKRGRDRPGAATAVTGRAVRAAVGLRESPEAARCCAAVQKDPYRGKCR